MNIANQPDLVGFIIFVIVGVNTIIGSYLIKRKVTPTNKVIVKIAVLNAAFLAIFLFLCLHSDGFSLSETFIVFSLFFAIQMSMAYTYRKLHETFFKK